MAVWYAPDEVPADLAGSVVTIGVFDAVHRGHQAVIGTAARQARERRLPVVAVTFDPNPLAVIRPEAAPVPLTSVDERAELLCQAGADHVLVLPFTRDRSEQLAEDFVDDVVVGVLKARMVVIGEDFRFGYRAKGDVGLLREVGRRAGFDVVALEPVGERAGDADSAGEPLVRWSSTAVRELLGQGDVARVWQVLGRPWSVTGVVTRGDQRGRELGFPTANVPTPAGVAVPADGVYAGQLDALGVGEGLPAAISVGSNPTFEGAGHRVEAYVLDRDDLDLYGRRVTVRFLDHVRGQRRFDSVAELIAAMHDDVAAVRERLRGVDTSPAVEPGGAGANGASS